ncbi:hypothetical protein [Dawidia soli]|uniref:Uncharacterized protein n=1 Tax=Dawidia soli TaxID=2782352 RepID=A0AAP2DET3_9BACT|nr:hypothetical protein [Dawidia soli]MBT1689460.1 hypothetical protein [Dawidia soli]
MILLNDAVDKAIMRQHDYYIDDYAARYRMESIKFHLYRFARSERYFHTALVLAQRSVRPV